MSDEVWTEADINNMSMAEYAEHRKYLMDRVRAMTPEEAREAMEIPKPRPPFRFTSF